MTSLLLVTNVWNEKERIPDLVEVIDKQTLKPELWFWIDDGSVNGSYNKIIGAKTKIPLQVFTMPEKQKGNLDTIGRAYSLAHSYIIHLEFDYMALADVDNRFPSDYFEKMCAFMDAHPEIGTLSAQSKADRKRNLDNPMGGGKIVRWSVVNSFEKYWDLAPDSFLNIKARALGLKAVALQNYFIDAEPSVAVSSKGRFRYGRRAYYVKRHIFLVLYQAFMFILKRDSAAQYLRGFWQEWARGKWHCKDDDVLYNYGLVYRVRTFTLGRLLAALRRMIR